MIQHTRPHPRSPERVVIVGASGFVGRDLQRQLAQDGVVTVALSSTDVDLTAPDSVERLLAVVAKEDALVLVSALTPDRGKDAATFMRNVTMGQHMAACVERAGCGHVVYVGSDAAYHDDANPVRETSCASPGSYHGLMHLVREHMLTEAAKKAGTPFVALRPTLLYGAGDTHNGYGPNRFVRTAQQEGRIALFGGGEERRDHLHIADLSRVIALCLQHRSSGVLNVATGNAVSFADVAAMVAEVAARPVTIQTSARANPITHRHFDVTELLRAFPGFGFTSLRDGLAAMVAGATV